MHNLKDGLKARINEIITGEDIYDIVLLLRDKFDLKKYINEYKPLEFNYEDVHGESLESAIDYDPNERTLIINNNEFMSKFTPTYDVNTQPYNWMILIYELLYEMEEILLYKYEVENIDNNVTEIVKLYEDFIARSKNASTEYSKFLRDYKSNETTKNTEIVNPVERIKMLHAYFNTLDIFKKINTDINTINKFKSIFACEVLKGYSIDDQNVYPLRNIFFQNSYLDGQFFMGQFSWYDNEAMNSISDATKKVNSIEERLALGYPIDSVDYNLVRRNKI